MYDTVNFWIDRVDISGGNTFDVLPYLSEITERQNEREYSCSGKVEGYDVHVSNRGLCLVGSLPKFCFEGDNVQTMTRRSSENAIQKMCDMLNTDIKQAHVTRIDVASAIPMKRPPTDYYNYLGSKAYFERVQATSNTLYYNNRQKQLIFYDKAAECKTVPDSWKNALRYEMRITNRINRQLKADVRAGMLYDEKFYTSMVVLWRDEFKSIQKINEQEFMTDNITTVRDAETAYYAYCMQKVGQSSIDDFMSDLKAKNIFKERPRYSELKKRLQTTYEIPKGQKSELTKELEDAICNIARYAR